MKKVCVFIFLSMAFVAFASCSNDSSDKKELKKPEQGVIEKKQHEIATEAVKSMKDPVDKAKSVSNEEDERNKEFKKAFDNK